MGCVNHRRIPRFFALLLCAVIVGFSLLLSPAVRAATLAETRGIGARAIGMGGAFTGVADDISGLYYNPAGMAQVKDTQFCFEYLFVSPRLYVQEGSGPEEVLVDKWTKAPMIGFMVNLSEAMEFLDRNVVLGINGIFPDNFKTIYKARYGTFYDPYFSQYGDSTNDQAIGLWTAIAVDIFPWLMVGGGVTVQIHGEKIIMNMAMSPDVPPQPILDQSTSQLDITTEIYPVAGILLKPTERLRLGFTYRKELKFIAAGGNQMLPSLYIDDGLQIRLPLSLVLLAEAHYRPLQLALGVSYQLTDDLLLAVDVTYYDWRPCKSESSIPLDPPMKEVVVPRIGAEYQLTEDLALRFGYSFQESPQKQQRLGYHVNLLDNDVHSLSIGAGVFWDAFGFFRKPAHISVFYEPQILIPRTFHNVHPGKPELRSSGYFHTFGLGFTFFM